MDYDNKKWISSFLGSLPKRLHRLDLNSLWPGFHAFPVALYDDENVYLSGFNELPKGFVLDDVISVGERDSRFYGNTAINMEGQLVAIWDTRTIPQSISPSRLTSLIVHESFHAFQQEINEQRYADEMLLLRYPFEEENLALRFLERRELIRSVFAESNREYTEAMRRFAGLRERRRNIIKELLDYELALETYEGAAAYVETLSYHKLSDLPLHYCCGQICRDLSEFPSDLKSFRASCLSPGVFMAMMLDRSAPGWKKSFLRVSDYLYDFLLKTLNVQPYDKVLPEPLDDALERAHELSASDRRARQYEVDRFFEDTGYHVILKGSFMLSRYDPMNIVPTDNGFFNRHFFECAYGTRQQQKITLEQPCLVWYSEPPYRFNRVEFFASKKPSEVAGNVLIEGVGNLPGSLELRDNTTVITLKE